MNSILALPYYLLTSLAIGYVGYFIAYHGYEVREKDKNYKVLLFSLPSVLILFNKSFLASFVLAIILLSLTVCFAGFWRTKGRKLLEKFLFKKGISNTNDNGTVLEDLMEIVGSKKINKNVLSVYLNNGTIYHSYLYKHMPSNNKDENKYIENCEGFLMDTKGNVLMYIDKIRVPDKDKTIIETYKNNDVALTFVPKESIRTIKLVTRKVK